MMYLYLVGEYNELVSEFGKPTTTLGVLGPHGVYLHLAWKWPSNLWYLNSAPIPMQISKHLMTV